MAYTVGIILFAFGILFAVCVHEAGHMGAAKAFGMKVSRYFVGFGPTLWSFRRGETEYGVKAIPLGGFVKIVGMTPQDDDVKPEDEPRAMWRFPVWKRTIVLSAGSITHFILAIATLWVIFVFVGIPDGTRINDVSARIASVQKCVSPTWQYDPTTKQQKACDPAKDPQSPAAQAGLQPGDVITAIGGEPVPNYGAMRAKMRAITTDQDVTIAYRRGGQTRTATVHVVAVERTKDDIDPNKTYADVTAADLERAGMLGVGMDIASQLPVHRAGPVEGVGMTFKQVGHMVTATFQSLKKIPEKIPNLVSAIAGHQRDPETPVSVVGASLIGGELFQLQDWLNMLGLFATLNLFFGIFNLFPLLPMDGGHIAIAWFERLRSWLAAKRGRPDPGRVDYYKLMPITLAVISIMGVFVLLTVTADIVNPVTLPK